MWWWISWKIVSISDFQKKEIEICFDIIERNLRVTLTNQFEFDFLFQFEEFHQHLAEEVRQDHAMTQINNWLSYKRVPNRKEWKHNTAYE